MKGDLGLFILSLVLLAAAVAAGVIAKRKFRVAHENTYDQRFARWALAITAVASLGFLIAVRTAPSTTWGRPLPHIIIRC